MSVESISIVMVSNLFRTFVNQKIISIFFDSEDKDKKAGIAGAFVFYSITTLGYILFQRVEINVLTNLTGLFIMSMAYKGSLKKKLLSVCLVYIINVSCDVIIVLIFSDYAITKEISDSAEILTVLLIAVCETFIERIVTCKRDSEFIFRHWKILLFIPICSFVIIHHSTVIILTNRTVAVIQGIGLLIINIIAFYFYSAMEESYLENIENAAALQSARIYEHQLEIIMNTQEQIRSLQHDMKYHLRELANMAKDHSVESILSYVEEMNVLTDNPDEIVYSGNKEIDGNLNYLLKRAKERLKDVSIDLKIPENYLGSQYDINVILSNLLENAITAAENSAEKTLSVKIFLDKSLLYIIIRNSYDGEIKNSKFSCHSQRVLCER